MLGFSGSSLCILEKIKPWKISRCNIDFLLVLASTKTAEHPGISEAGLTPESRRFTALADAELLLKGPGGCRVFPLPTLSAGVSPALLSYVASRRMGLRPLVVSLGLDHQPTFNHLRMESVKEGPAACLSTGKAMSKFRVKQLWIKGKRIGENLRRPLLLAECVPGGTSTAQAVLTALGIKVEKLISSSSVRPPFALKRKLVEEGLRQASFRDSNNPISILAAVGDPFQVIATGIIVGSISSGQPLLLGGGSQMVAVLALAFKAINVELRRQLASQVIIGTTAWLAEECSETAQPSSFERLLLSVGKRFGVDIIALSSGVRFTDSLHQSLRDYELGFVKEGVGAGALLLLAQLQGHTAKDLVNDCELALQQLLMSSSRKGL